MSKGKGETVEAKVIKMGNAQAVAKKLQAIRADLYGQFYERRAAIDGSLVAMLAGEHVMMLGPPGCLAGDTVVNINRAGNGRRIAIADLVARQNAAIPGGVPGNVWDSEIPTLVQRADGDFIRLAQMSNAWCSGTKETFAIVTNTGREIRATADHPFMSEVGQFVRLGDLRNGDIVAVNDGMISGTSARARGDRVHYPDRYTRFHPSQRRSKDGFRTPTHRLAYEAEMNGLGLEEFVSILRTDQDRARELCYLDSGIVVHHVNGNVRDNRPLNLASMTQAQHAAEHSDEATPHVLARVGFERIVSIDTACEEETYDLEVADDPHCFVANGFVVHNTAKSALASALCTSLDGASYFAWLMTKFTTPEELFGAMSVKGLMEDRMERNTAGKLPQAHIAFIDEAYKANSAILNALLTLINERKFHNGTRIEDCPLVTLFGASNELPEGKELEALHDRFLVRLWVDRIADRDNMAAMLRAPEPRMSTSLTLAELHAARTAVDAMAIDDSHFDALLDVKEKVEADGVVASDRRWRKILRALKAASFLAGAKTVTEDAFDMLPDMLWREPSERPALVQLVGKVANPVGAKVAEIVDMAQEAYRNLPDPDVGRTQMMGALGDVNSSSRSWRRCRRRRRANASRKQSWCSRGCTTRRSVRRCRQWA